MITGGQSYVSSPPSFSNDGKRLLVCTGNTVSIFSTTSGLLTNELEGHTGRVTSVVVVPAEPTAVKFMNYCWTSSLDGTIRYWDFASGEMIKKVEVKLPVHSMAIPGLLRSLSESKSRLYAFISVEDTSKPVNKHKALRGRIQICNLSTSQRVGGFLTETRKPEAIITSPSGEYLGIQNKRKIHIWKIPTNKYTFSEVKMIKLHHTKDISVLAFHPTGRIVAGGDIVGRILIWRNFGSRKFSGRKHMDIDYCKEKGGSDDDDEDDTECSPTTWHWHSSEVKFLSFSSDGAYLYSGGKEGVIVVWQLETGKRKFKPRLGSPLLYFTQSPDVSLCSVSCADNRVHLLKMPSMDVVKSIGGIKSPLHHQATHEELGKGLCFSTSGLIALSAENYCVQIFSLFDNRELCQVQISERNYLPVEAATVVVTLVSLSLDCSLMGTVENKLPENAIGDLVCLKFWHGGSQPGDYSLSTIIYEPHSDSKISGLAFHPHNSMAASSSYGGDFKIWTCSLETQTKDATQKHGWRCQSIGSYKKLPMTYAAFSADGSILAIAADTVVTLWNPKTNVLVAVVGEMLSPITKVSFVGKSTYLVSFSGGQKPQLTLWNLSSLSIDWCYNLLVEDISSKDNGIHFAVLALGSEADSSGQSDQDGFILVFNLKKPNPIAIWSVKKAKGGRIAFILGDPFSLERNVGGKGAPRMLAYLNHDHEYIVFDPLQNEKEVYQTVRRVLGSNNDLMEESELFGYASIYGKLPESNSKANEILATSFTPSERPWETIFSGPSHILPPLSKLCSAFFESLLEKRSGPE